MLQRFESSLGCQVDSTPFSNILLVFLVLHLFRGKVQTHWRCPLPYVLAHTFPHTLPLRTIHPLGRSLGDILNYLTLNKTQNICSNMLVPSKKIRLVSRVFKGYSKSLKFSNTMVLSLEEKEKKKEGRCSNVSPPQVAFLRRKCHKYDY